MRKSSLGEPTEGMPVGASFRDSAGFVFKDRTGVILRQINPIGRPDYDLLMETGLYEVLVEGGLLVSHVPVDPTKKTALVIKPEQIPCISYPFEWSFSQLQDAALLTLAVQKRALKHGMTLKDSSAYNVQFLKGKPIFIDTLSFESYEPGKPWQAYRQFCQHFLAPLALMAYTDVRLSQLLRIHIDGIPLDLAAKLLPRKAKLRPGLGMHIMMHSRAQRAKAAEHTPQTRSVTQSSLEAILDSLERSVKKLKLLNTATEWGAYYDQTNYTADAADEKAALLVDLLKPLKAKRVLDLGGNNGRYSRVLNAIGVDTICSDIDPNAVEANYQFSRRHKESQMLPLLVDVTNPGGALGWANAEREPIHERLQSDVVMSLALIHHLAISNNLPFDLIARYFKQFGVYLVLEFVPKEDSQVQKLLSTRKDIFPEYSESNLKKTFAEHYKLIKEAKIQGTKRTLYLFKRK